MSLLQRGPRRRSVRQLPSLAQLLALVLGLAIAAASAASRIADPYELRLARELVFDEFQRLAPRPYREVGVRVVDIDEASLAEIGQWPWPRSILAALVGRIHDLGASAIVFDMVFPEPDRLSPSRLAQQEDLRITIGADAMEALARNLPDNDTLFRDAISKKPVVLGFSAIPGRNERRPAVKAGLAFTGTDPREALPRLAAAAVNLPLLDTAASGVGAITLSPLDSQGVVRRIPLFWSDGSSVYPSLIVEALRVAQKETTVLIHSRSEAPFAMTALGIGRFEMPTTGAGELRIRFGHEIPTRYVSAVKILSNGDDYVLRSLISGHIVLIGTSATGLFDGRATALAETVPGVAVHAQALEQILTADHLLRPDWVDPFEAAWTLLIGVLVAAVSIFCAPITALIYGGLAAAATFLGAWGAFRLEGLLLDPVLPSAAGLVLYVALISFRYFVSDRERRFVRQAFARYVAPEYLTQIEQNPHNLRLGGDEREVTVLFLDIRSFTALSERLSPTQVVEFLNLLFSRLSEDILAEGGTIDKYIGDSLMAFWNAPIPTADHAARACRAALRMRDSLQRLNEADAFRFRQRGDALPAVGIGIGINTGPALVGNMGSEIRFNYSVVGDVVNVASRIEGQCKQLLFDIVVARTVAAAAPGFAYLEAGTLDLRGKAGREKLLLLVGDQHIAAAEEFRMLRGLHEELLDSIRQNRADWKERLAACHAQAETTFPALRNFYQGIPERLSDFRTSLRSAPVKEAASGLVLAHPVKREARGPEP